MRPSDTVYRLSEDEENNAFLSLVEKAEIPHGDIAFPTIVAVRGDAVIGGISRHPTDDRILVEPIYAPNIYVYIRLIEAMENVLRSAGVKWFEFRVDKSKYSKYIDLLKKSNAVVDLGSDDQGKCQWFRRYIDGR